MANMYTKQVYLCIYLPAKHCTHFFDIKGQGRPLNDMSFRRSGNR